MIRASGSAINDVIAAVYRLHADIVAAGDAVAGHFGLSSARWQVLGAIAARDGVTVPDLARLIGTARQSVQRIVSEMIDEGLLVPADNPRHRRAKLVGMTERGRGAFEAVMAAWAPHAAALEVAIGSDASNILAREMAALATTFRDIAAQNSRGAGPVGTISSMMVDRNDEP